MAPTSPPPRRGGWFQRLYGTDFATSPWYLRGNAPLHAFATLQAALCLAAGVRLWLPGRSVWWGLAAAVLIGVGDELAQRFSATRGFAPRDWACDAAGLGLAALLLLGLQLWRGATTERRP